MGIENYVTAVGGFLTTILSIADAVIVGIQKGSAGWIEIFLVIILAIAGLILGIIELIIASAKKARWKEWKETHKQIEPVEQNNTEQVDCKTKKEKWTWEDTLLVIGFIVFPIPTCIIFIWKVKHGANNKRGETPPRHR